MFQYKSLQRNDGFSLVEVLVAFSVLMFVVLSVIQLITHQQREIQSMAERLLANDIKIELQNFLLNPDSCNCLFRGRTFNTTGLANPWNPSLTSIPQGFQLPIPSPPTNCVPLAGQIIPQVGTQFDGSHVTVEALQMRSFTHQGNGVYTADLEVQLGNLVRQLKNIRVPMIFNVDLTANGPSNRPFVSCSSANASDFRVFYEPAPVNSGVVVDSGPLVCSKPTVTIQYGSKFLDQNDDSTGRLDLIVNGTVVGYRKGGARSSGGGDVTHAPSTIHGLWSGPCTGGIVVQTNWVQERDAPRVDESYLHIQFSN